MFVTGEVKGGRTKTGKGLGVTFREREREERREECRSEERFGEDGNREGTVCGRRILAE